MGPRGPATPLVPLKLCIVLENPSEGVSPTGAWLGTVHTLPRGQAWLLPGLGDGEAGKAGKVGTCSSIGRVQGPQPSGEHSSVSTSTFRPLTAFDPRISRPSPLQLAAEAHVRLSVVMEN